MPSVVENSLARQGDLMEWLTRYLQLENLRGKVPDDVLQRELGEKVPRFEALLPRARQVIRTVRLDEVFPAELEQGRIELERFLGQWGNVSVEEVCKIALIVRWLKPRAVFEFGTYNGMTTLQIALNAPDDCVLRTLDVPPQAAAMLEVGEIDRHLAQKLGFFDVPIGGFFKGHRVEPRIQQLWGDSLAFDSSPFEGSIDLVYVDAGHTYPYVIADSLSAFRMVRPGGVILWHDCYQVLHPDVLQALCEFAEKGRQIHHLRGTCLAVYREGA